MRAESAVEPTKSENITVTWRRSARSSGWGAWGTRRGRCVNGGRLTARVVTQSSDGVEQLHPVPKRRDAKLLQVLCRQARKNRLVYVILAECRLILPEAQAPQPDHNVHDGAHNRGWRASSSGGSEGVQGRLDYGCLRGSQRPLRSYRQWQCLSVIVKIPEWPRNPDFPAPEGPIFYLSARLWIIPKKHAPMFTREAYATRHHRQRSPGAGG